ncbi:hypothetical protein AAFF_G00268590, partial [Aldrovandia affinis]
AFDTVEHSILLSSLAATGICGTALAWIESYLSGRSFQVAWAGKVSPPRSLPTGVPQGSVLGPLLFSLYIHSLGSVISAHGLSSHCYADDTQLFLSFSPSDTQVSTRISACLRDIQSWMDSHHLKLNPACSSTTATLEGACVTPPTPASVEAETMPRSCTMVTQVPQMTRPLKTETCVCLIWGESITATRLTSPAPSRPMASSQMIRRLFTRLS